MKLATMLLPGLTHDEITLQDRIDNIKLIQSKIDVTGKGKKYKNDVKSLKNDHYIESLRAATMLFFTYPENEVEHNEDYKAIHTWYIHTFVEDSFAELLVNSYTFFISNDHIDLDESSPYRNSKDILNDLFNYYNKVIIPVNIKITEEFHNPNIDEEENYGGFDQYGDYIGDDYGECSDNTNYDLLENRLLKTIDRDFIEGLIKNSVYGISRTRICYYHEIINSISPKKLESNFIIEEIKNIRMLSNDILSDHSIERRIEYYNHLRSLVLECPVNQVNYLYDNITIEYTRIALMVCFNTISYLETVNFSDDLYKELFGNNAVYHRSQHNICSIIWDYSEQDFDNQFYDDIMDMIYYNNIMIETNNIHLEKYHLNMYNFFEKTNTNSDIELAKSLCNKFRSDKINKIIN